MNLAGLVSDPGEKWFDIGVGEGGVPDIVEPKDSQFRLKIRFLGRKAMEILAQKAVERTPASRKGLKKLIVDQANAGVKLAKWALQDWDLPAGALPLLEAEVDYSALGDPTAKIDFTDENVDTLLHHSILQTLVNDFSRRHEAFFETAVDEEDEERPTSGPTSHNPSDSESGQASSTDGI